MNFQTSESHKHYSSMINKISNMDNVTSCRALGFLLWFRKFYNGKTDKTYHEIAKEYCQANYGTVRVYLLALAEAGYVIIRDRGKRTQEFTVVEEKFMDLI